MNVVGSNTHGAGPDELRTTCVASGACGADGGLIVRRLVIALLASTACLGDAAFRAAQAEPLVHEASVAGLPADEIFAIVRSTGFEPIGPPVRRPGLYVVVLALDPYDRAVRMTLDAHTGRVVAVTSAAMAPATSGYEAPPGALADRQRGYPSGRGYGPLAGRFDDLDGFGDATGALPSPPRSIPAPRLPNASHTAAVPPLPRPRPADAGTAQQPPSTAPTDIAMPPVTPLE